MTDSLQRVVVVTPDPVAPANHEAEMIALVDKRDADAAALVRPEWLPEKFKTVEEMAASYKELEAKQSTAQPTPAVAPVAAVVPPVVAPAADPLAVPVEAAAAVQKAGLDITALETEFASTGAISDASYAALAAAGFDKSIVDSHIAGRQALVAQFQSEVMGETPGGADKYPEMIAWARVNLNDTEIAAFNSAVSTNDKARAKLAVAGLGAKFSAAVGSEPGLLGGRTVAGAADVFESVAQMKAAMANPLYKEDPAYRNAVRAKLGRSNIL